MLSQHVIVTHKQKNEAIARGEVNARRYALSLIQEIRGALDGAEQSLRDRNGRDFHAPGIAHLALKLSRGVAAWHCYWGLRKDFGLLQPIEGIDDPAEFTAEPYTGLPPNDPPLNGRPSSNS